MTIPVEAMAWVTGAFYALLGAFLLGVLVGRITAGIGSSWRRVTYPAIAPDDAQLRQIEQALKDASQQTIDNAPRPDYSGIGAQKDGDDDYYAGGRS